MPTLTASTLVTIQDATPVVDSITLSVVPAGTGAPNGTGRLVHPTLGTLDYTLPPHEWTNLDGDVVIKPTWVGTKTLTSTANTLWPGNLRDVVVEESWVPSPGLSMPMAMLRTMMAFFVNPPDLTLDEYVEWYPSYSSTLGFKVVLEDLLVGDASLRMSPQSKGTELSEFPITLKIRPVSRIA